MHIDWALGPELLVSGNAQARIFSVDHTTSAFFSRPIGKCLRFSDVEFSMQHRGDSGVCD